MRTFGLQLSVMRRRPQLGAVGGQVHWIDGRGSLTGRGRFLISFEACRVEAFVRNPIAHPAVMMRRSAVLAVGGYRKGFEHAEDYDLWLRLIASGYEIDNLPDDILLYRVHQDQISNRFKLDQALSSIKTRLLHMGEDASRIGTARSIGDILWLSRSMQEDARVFILKAASRILDDLTPSEREAILTLVMDLERGQTKGEFLVSYSSHCLRQRRFLEFIQMALLASILAPSEVIGRGLRKFAKRPSIVRIGRF